MVGDVGHGESLRDLARALAVGVGPSPPPPVTSGAVRRRGELARLAEQPDAPCVLVNAPAGYGKTTMLATLAQHDERPCAWLTLGRGDDDPTSLLARLLLALDSVDPVADVAFEQVLLSEADLESVRLPRLADLLAARADPFLLVLDDAHELRSRRAREIVRTVVEHVPSGSRVARRDPRRRVASGSLGRGPVVASLTSARSIS